MKANLREIIHYIDESTLEKAKNEKVQKQESPSKTSKDVEESVDKMISNRMSKAYSEWKSNQDTQPFNENIEKEYQKLLETLSPEQEEVLTKYCDEIFASGAETEEFFYRLGIKDGLRLKSTVKSVLEMMSQYEVYVFEADKMIQGFVGLNAEYIEGIFVSDEMQSCGIGKLLLDYVKDKKVSLRLNVYQKNARAISFYQREGFIIQCEDLDEDTGEKEYTMLWKRK